MRFEDELIGHVDADRPCFLLPGGGELGYGWLRGRAGRLAGALRAAGVGAGDRVVVQVAKSPEALALELACFRIGAVLVPLNTAYTADELAFFVGDARPAAVVVDPGVAPPPGPATFTSDAGGWGTLDDASRVADPVDEAVTCDADDWAAMLYTSGTTGRPKGAMLSFANLLSNARALVAAWRFEPDDVLVHALPVFHVHGLFVAAHCALAVGAAMRFHPAFDVDAVLDDLPGSTVFMGVPTHYHRLLASPRLDADRCASMRLFTSGSAPLPAHEHDAFAARTGHRIVERYGLTESMILTSNPYDGDRVAGTVGFALPGIEVRLGEDDVVEARGPNVFLGYWGLPDRTAEVRRDDGWFVTGDIGAMDDDGRLTLVGRASDLVISGGLNVYPKEVEALIEQVPGVEECAVIGLPDDDFGERVVAVIVADDGVGDDAVLGACTPLARFKHPKQVVRVGSLPRNAMGKVQKAVLRREAGVSDPPDPG